MRQVRRVWGSWPQVRLIEAQVYELFALLLLLGSEFDWALVTLFVFFRTPLTVCRLHRFIFMDRLQKIVLFSWTRCLSRRCRLASPREQFVHSCGAKHSLESFFLLPVRLEVPFQTFLEDHVSCFRALTLQRLVVLQI